MERNMLRLVENGVSDLYNGQWGIQNQCNPSLDQRQFFKPTFGHSLYLT